MNKVKKRLIKTESLAHHLAITVLFIRWKGGSVPFAKQHTMYSHCFTACTAVDLNLIKYLCH